LIILLFSYSIVIVSGLCWSLLKEYERKIILSTEMTWLRRIIGKTRKDRTENEKIRKKTTSE